MNKIKSIVFIAMFCLIFSGVSWFFRPLPPNATVIYYEKPYTIDVLFVGSSHVYNNINPNIIWQETGIASYDFASSAQSLWASYNYIIEAQKTQNPNLVVLDIFSAFNDFRFENGYNKYDWEMYSSFVPSYNKINLVNVGIQADQRTVSMIDLLRNHTRWRDISQNVLHYTQKDYKQNSTRRFKGFTGNSISNDFREYKDFTYPMTNEEFELHEKSALYLQKIIDLSKEKGFELLLIKTPITKLDQNEDEQRVYNTIRRIAKENGIVFADFNYKFHRDAMGLDFASDFLDINGHFNFGGATKFSKYLAQYLKTEYNLPDRRGDSKYKSWDESSEAYFRYEALQIAKTLTNLPAYLDAIKDVNQNLIFITSVSSDAGTKIQPIASQLEPLGITVDLSTKIGNSFICLYEPSSGYRYEDLSATQKIIKNVYKDSLPINVEVSSAGAFDGGYAASIKINGKEVAKNKRGLNIAIYDKETKTVFDSFYVDTYEDETFAIKR